MNIDPVKILKISVGAASAAALAYAVGLDSAASAGTICLLTIQDTRRETLSITVKRAAAFCIVTALCRAVFGAAGFGFVQLGAVIGILLLICAIAHINEAASTSCVVAAHYFSDCDISLPMMKNELALFLIGAGTGVILNIIFMPVNIGRIRAVQKATDERIRSILRSMAEYMTAGSSASFSGDSFEEINVLLGRLRREAVRYIGNSFSGEKDYFYKYVKLRTAQCTLLTRIFADVTRLRGASVRGEPAARLLGITADRFDEINDAVFLAEEAEQMFEHYSAESLPENRGEFESRALMYHILCDIKQFIMLKRDFAAELSEKEKEIYWKWQKGAV